MPCPNAQNKYRYRFKKLRFIDYRMGSQPVGNYSLKGEFKVFKWGIKHPQKNKTALSRNFTPNSENFLFCRTPVFAAEFDLIEDRGFQPVGHGTFSQVHRVLHCNFLVESCTSEDV